MENEQMKQAGFDMLYLVKCALHNEIPQKEKIQTMELDSLYTMCQFHSLTAIVCMALESAQMTLSKNWTDAKSKAIRKVMLLDAERNRLLTKFEDGKIWYMPLKGVFLKEYYPKLGMRQMADNDILYDKNYQNNVCEIFKNSGYEVKGFAKGNHDVYEKPPIYNFEMHTSLFGANHNPQWVAYYSNVKTRLKKDAENNYGYHFSDEDFYIYITVHACKHYNSGGTGLRTLVDSFVFLNAKQETLDWDYIVKELEQLGIANYETMSRKLCQNVFSRKTSELSQDEAELLEYFLFSGTYGTTKNMILKKMEKLSDSENPISKAQYLLMRLFPDMDFYKAYYPFFYRHKWLLPVGWFFRLFRGITVRKKRFQNEIKTIKDLNVK